MQSDANRPQFMFGITPVILADLTMEVSIAVRTADWVDGTDASRRAIALRITIRLLLGALRRPSSGCSRLGLQQTSFAKSHAADPQLVGLLSIQKVIDE